MVLNRNGEIEMVLNRNGEIEMVLNRNGEIEMVLNRREIRSVYLRWKSCLVVD